MKMPRKKRRQQLNNLHIVLFGIVIGLFCLLVITIADRHLITVDSVSTVSTENRVNLGIMRYEFVDGTAQTRNDETFLNLKNFLLSLAEEDVAQGCDSYYNVLLASSDEKQVLLKYGCPFPNARMFAVNENGEWKTLSPTNQFDMLGVPSCEHVETNSIERSIAPICVNGLSATNESQDLTYVVR
jgi:hypothetical protein